MSEQDELDALQNATVEMTGRLDELPWPDDRRERAREVLAYISLTLSTTDPVLLASSVVGELTQRFTQTTNEPGLGGDDRFNDWIGGLLNAVGRLPVGSGRQFEQAAKKAAKTFQRSAQQRFSAVERRSAKAQSDVEALTANLEGRRAEIDALAERFRAQQEEAIEARFTQLDARTQDLQATAERHAQSIEALMTEQSEAFRKAQDERAEEYRERDKGYESHFETLEADAKRRVDALVSEMNTMRDRSAELVGAIGITGTAERYGKEFDEQQKAANQWRIVTLALGVLAVAAAIVAAFDHKATTAGTKLAIAILLGGVAAYTARQSARHRSREENARRLQLDLTAFPVFIEALPEEDRDAATVWMAERSFLGARGLVDDDDGGPSLLSQFLARRKGSAAAE